MSKEILDIVEDVKSGKTIIYIGKDLIMMNMAKYYEYVNLEKEPVSKRILQAKCEEIEKVFNVIKGKFIWVENNKLMCGRYADTEIELEERDFENKEEFNTLKEFFK